MFWLIVLFCLLFILLIMLYLRVMEDKRVKISREEMPGKVCIVTGADKVLGEALAQSFYGAGCKMVLVGSNRIELDRIRTHLFNMRPKDVPVYQPEIIAMDSNGPEFAVQDKVAEIIELCGQVDILINNSTIYTRADALSVKIETDICVMNVNYFAPIAFTKAILPYMIERKSGKIVFISSVAGKVPIPYRSSFAASKAAIQAFADSLRPEIAHHNVTVLVSSPQYIATDLTQAEVQLAGTSNEVLEKGITPMGGEPPQQLAEEILMSTLRGDNEYVPFSFRIAYWLRVISPPFYHFMMSRKVEKALETDAPSPPERF